MSILKKLIFVKITPLLAIIISMLIAGVFCAKNALASEWYRSWNDDVTNYAGIVGTPTVGSFFYTDHEILIRQVCLDLYNVPTSPVSDQDVYLSIIKTDENDCNLQTATTTSSNHFHKWDLLNSLTYSAGFWATSSALVCFDFTATLETGYYKISPYVDGGQQAGDTVYMNLVAIDYPPNKFFYYDPGCTDGTEQYAPKMVLSSDVLVNTGDYSTVNWFFPQNSCSGDPPCYNGKYYLSNDTFTDWSFYVHTADTDDFDYLELIVYYTDQNNVTYNDYEEISYHDEVWNWTIDRTHPLVYGAYYSQGVLIGANYATTSCPTRYDPNCIWYDIASSSIITWYASTTGGSIFDYGIASFTPATTTQDALNAKSDLDNITKALKNIFPFSLGFQFRDIWQQVKVTSTTTVDLKLRDILPTEAQSLVPATSSLFSLEMIDAGDIYSTKVMPIMNYLVYIIWFGFIIGLVFSRLRKSQVKEN